jgi:ferredoxin
MKRRVIRIDEDKCNGCGLCIPECPEGAIQIIDGKARLISDLFCDGLGACLGHCPQGAIAIEERDAEPYDERQVMENIIRGGQKVIAAHLRHLKEHSQREYLEQAIAFLKEKSIETPRDWAAEAPQGARGCPGSKIMDLRGEHEEPGQMPPPTSGKSALRQWPVQLHLLSPYAPYFKDAHLLITADCVPFAHPNFHERFLKGKILVILCPKLDNAEEVYIEKLAEVFRHNEIKSITLLHMEVPCCFGLTRIVEEALRRSAKNVVVKEYTISVRGQVI